LAARPQWLDSDSERLLSATETVRPLMRGKRPPSSLAAVDRVVHRRALHRARHRWLRPQRHARSLAPFLRDRPPSRGTGRTHGGARTGPDRREDLRRGDRATDWRPTSWRRGLL